VPTVDDRIWGFLRSLDLRPGDRVPSERDLAAALSLSRPTLRIGLAALVGRGLLETRSQSGTYVSETNPDDLLEVRLLLEPYAARRAAGMARPSHVVGLNALLDAAEASVDDGPAFASADLRIHEAVGDIMGNPLVNEIMGGLRTRLARSRDLTSTDAELRRQTLAELSRLVRAIRDGDSDGAELAMREHLFAVGAASTALHTGA
jgi:DNA-binding FadR family transcriptional regulator